MEKTAKDNKEVDKQKKTIKVLDGFGIDYLFDGVSVRSWLFAWLIFSISLMFSFLLLLLQ